MDLWHLLDQYSVLAHVLYKDIHIFVRFNHYTRVREDDSAFAISPRAVQWPAHGRARLDALAHDLRADTALQKRVWN